MFLFGESTAMLREFLRLPLFLFGAIDSGRGLTLVTINSGLSSTALLARRPILCGALLSVAAEGFLSRSGGASVLSVVSKSNGILREFLRLLLVTLFGDREGLLSSVGGAVFPSMDLCLLGIRPLPPEALLASTGEASGLVSVLARRCLLRGFRSLSPEVFLSRADGGREMGSSSSLLSDKEGEKLRAFL